MNATAASAAQGEITSSDGIARASRMMTATSTTSRSPTCSNASWSERPATFCRAIPPKDEGEGPQDECPRPYRPHRARSNDA